MDCLLLEITTTKDTDFYDRPSHPQISAEDFRILTKAYPSFFVSIKENASVICGKCGSFQVPSSILFQFLSSPILSSKGNVDEENEDFGIAEEISQGILNSLTEEINATDEEWESFMVKGTPDLRPIFNNDGKFIFPETGGYALRFKFNEVVFSFGEECISCYRVFHNQGEV